MGLLDIILAGSTYGKNKRQDEQAAQYKALLANDMQQWTQPGMPGQAQASTMGAAPQLNTTVDYQPMGGLMSDYQASPAFFLKAAGVPGYEGLAAGAQSNAAAMQRQQQGQQWDANNISAESQARMEQQSQQYQQTFGLQKEEADRMAAYREKQLQLEQWQMKDNSSRGWAGLDLQRQQAARAGQMSPADIRAAQVELSTLDERVSTATDAIDYVSSVSAGRRVTNPSEKATYSAA